MTPVRLVPAGASRTRIAALALAVALPAAGAAGYWVGMQERVAGASAAEPPGGQALAAAVQRLAEARMALGLSEARSQELERQIDALNQRLRECQDELAFFRKAGERRH